MGEEGSEARPPSYGKMSEHHWSRARRDSNRESIEYYRERSKAPGVEAGGAERNFYCMECDGVIPHEPAVRACPHCGAAIEGNVRRYFNWVEMDARPRSELRAFLPWVLLALCAVLLLGALAVYWLV